MIFMIYVAFGAEFSKKKCRFEFLSQFLSISKNNHLNWSSGSEYITDLKSLIFWGGLWWPRYCRVHNLPRVLILLPNQWHWIDNFKIFLLVYYMWYFKWIFDFSWKLDGRLKPLSTISKRVYKLSGTVVTMFKGPWL